MVTKEGFGLCFRDRSVTGATGAHENERQATESDKVTSFNSTLSFLFFSPHIFFSSVCFSFEFSFSVS